MEFETHIMPRMAKEYRDAGKKKVPFDLDKIRNLGRVKGDDNNKAWEEIDFQDKVNRLVTNGLIEELGCPRWKGAVPN